MPSVLFKGLTPSRKWTCSNCQATGFATAQGEALHDCDHPTVFSLREASPFPPTDANLMPPSQGKRDAIRPRYDLIPQQWLEALARIFEEGRKPRPGLPEGYGDSWKQGGLDFLQDCLNHAQHHLLLYHAGDRTEEHLAKVAWNVLAVNYFNEVPKSGSSKD